MTLHTESPTPRASLAIPFMLGASCLVAATSIIAKALGTGPGDLAGLHPFQVSAGRFVFAFLTLMLFLLASPGNRPSLAGANWGLHLVRSLCGWLGVTSVFAAVARMPVADATAISFLSPLVTMGLAVAMLGEHLGVRKIAAALLALSGAVMILKPGTDAFQAAAFFALAAAVFMGLEAIFIKRLSETEPVMRVLVINNGIGAIVSSVVACFFWSWPSGLQWPLLAMLGAVMVSAQTMLIQAMKRGDASAVAPVLYSVLVFAAIYDMTLYGVVPDWLAVLGGLLILSGALLLSRARTA
ncbi:DMT family transporter [Oricola sp.]|uniref:DMT family transporter n=1 Tax=Oricola sp. TaxID=1979950 RepID=UPI0025D5A678|nr:DMT family transporter [Oricola sp.]MCI5076341.1 DMT family transporter [Oricola sp.]